MLPPPSAPRKRRTREHVIADLAVNHVERQALLCGFSIERVVHDYGIDAILFTYDANGETESDWLPLQVKATDHPRYVENGRCMAIRVARADLRSWLATVFPVILIGYDAGAERAHWLYVQAHFGKRRFQVNAGPDQVTVRVPTAQVLNAAAIRQFAEFRNRILAQLGESVIRHE